MKKLYFLLLACFITVASVNANSTVPTPQQIKQAHMLIKSATAYVKNKPGLHKTAAMRAMSAVPTVPDSAYEWTWDTDANAWVDTAYYRVHYWSNAAGTLEDSAVAQAYYSGIYINVDETINTYDANGNLLTELDLVTDGVEMVPNQLFTYTYDANNNRITQLAQAWNGTSYDNSTYTSALYDANNNALTDTSLYWDGSAFSGGRVNIYTWDVNNNMLSDTGISVSNLVYSYSFLNELIYDGNSNNTVLLYKTWNGSSFSNNIRYTNTYDGHHNQIESRSEQWVGSAYQLTSRDTLTYDSHNNQTSDIFQAWNGSVFVNNQEFVRQFDSNNNQTFVQVIGWDGAAWSIHISDNNYLYDAYNRQLMTASFGFNTAGDFITNGDSTYFYFGNVIAAVPHYAASGLQLYPNPAQNLLTLSSDEVLAPSRIVIFDALGRQVFAPIYMIGKTARINTAALKAGVYNLRITGLEGVSVHQFVKEE